MAPGAPVVAAPAGLSDGVALLEVRGLTKRFGGLLAVSRVELAVERGEVSALYAYSTDRLARSVEWSARLLNACRRAGGIAPSARHGPGPRAGIPDHLRPPQAADAGGIGP